jgi:hypothetical protein
MKKIIISILTAAALFTSCKKEVEPTPVLDCDCDRVVEANYFNIAGAAGGQPFIHVSFITINDCTGVQKNRNETHYSMVTAPKVGDCK